jgi:hypothetical protein
MIYALLIRLLALLLLIYYLCVVLQYCGFIHFTTRKIKLRYLFVPFYYFIFINNKKQKKQ